MAERQGGLGGAGRQRIRENIGGQVGGHDVTAWERQLHGSPRSTPASEKTAWEYPDSTRIYAYAYNTGTGDLWVRFKKYETPWVYQDVSTAVFTAFDSSPSKGRFVNSTLNYTQYRRATPEEVHENFDHA